MSFSPTLSFVRLQELKQWQGSFENLLQQSRNKPTPQEERCQDSPGGRNGGSKAEEWDKKAISPMKDFEQLLEQRLAEEPPVTVKDKPKKPFLRKGDGLARFRMARTDCCNRKTAPTKPRVAKTAATKSILKKTNPQYHHEVDLSPLEIPDFVRPRGTWKQVFETAKSDPKTDLGESESLENYDEFRKSLGGSGECLRDPEQFKSSSCTQVPAPVDDVGGAPRICFEGQHPLLSNDIPDSISCLKTPKLVRHMGDLTLEELRSEKELNVFETLEQRVDSSSFCSTNTSILNLLVSTPQKPKQSSEGSKVITEEGEQEQTGASIVDDSVISKYIPENIQEKLREVSTKTNVLQQFLLNLYNMDSEVCLSKKAATSTNTSFSDEDIRWSSRSPSISELESVACQNDSWKKIDVGVNTSFDLSSSKLDETVKGCQECEDLRAKYTEWKSKASGLKSQNSQLKLEVKQLQTDRDSLKKDVTNFEEKLLKYEDDLAAERKRFIKEKAYFENYVKEAQNRSSKKEREQISALKQELADVKELVKLKDAKNGATQARLRTQIKQQEKELIELKAALEKLQKENAKLTASQKYSRRPQEVKMLHEINKNLSKLAEKTLKDKSDHGDAVDGVCTVTQTCDAKGDKENKESEKRSTSQRVKGSSPKVGDRVSADHNLNGLTVEQQYETTFGSFSSPRNTSCSATIEKTEKTLPDGSIEVTYSNGNSKTVSADGKLIKMTYFNGDSRETDLRNQTIKYHYAAADSWHVQYPDGTEVMLFKDGHKCIKRTDGRTDVEYPDGTLRTINADGTEEQTFPDGRKTFKNLQGEQIILLPNGQREIHTEDCKRREYPDGTIRTLHKDGTVETVYANGRVRLKDANGALIMDTHQV